MAPRHNGNPAQPVLCPNQTQNRLGVAPNPILGGKVMRINRRWLRISLTLLLLPLIFALYARAAGDGECKETKYRWDIVHISTFSPSTAVEGGFADAEREERRRTIITRDKQSFRIRTRKKASSRDSRVYRFRNHFIIIVDINN